MQGCSKRVIVSSLSQDDLMPLHPSELFGDDQWKLDIGESEAKRLIETATRLPKDVTCVIDVGGVDGRFLESLAKTGYRGRAVLCDRSASGVRRSRFASVGCDSASLPFFDNSSDCVVCCEVLEHLPVRMLESTVAELIRVSSRYVLVTVPWNQQLARNHVLCPACAAVFHSD
jgi:ubiquinone/menaquinone biosynthesis C-methylase UbiE